MIGWQTVRYNIPLTLCSAWRDESARETHSLYRRVTDDFLGDPKGCHASPLLGKTVKIYEYIRRTLGVPMHGRENAIEFEGEQGKLRNTIGGYVSVIYHSIRNGDVSGQKRVQRRPGAHALPRLSPASSTTSSSTWPRTFRRPLPPPLPACRGSVPFMHDSLHVSSSPAVSARRYVLHLRHARTDGPYKAGPMQAIVVMNPVGRKGSSSGPAPSSPPSPPFPRGPLLSFNNHAQSTSFDDANQP